MSDGQPATTTPPTDNRAAYWQPHIDAWRASGLSAKRFCSQHSLPYGQFLYWSRKHSGVAGHLPASGAFARVVPVAGTRPSGLTISLPGGVQIGGIDADNVALLQRILAQL